MCWMPKPQPNAMTPTMHVANDVYAVCMVSVVGHVLLPKADMYIVGPASTICHCMCFRLLHMSLTKHKLFIPLLVYCLMRLIKYL